MSGRQAAFALLLLYALILAVGATQVCLHGTFSLTAVQDAPALSYCSQTLCDVTVELVFDRDSVADGNWPLSVQFADGTYLSSLHPELATANFSCDANGNIILSTAIVAQTAERMRLIWSYSAPALSTDCAYDLQTVNWATDFVSAQALLAYSGSGNIITYDALALSTTASLAAMSTTCPQPTTTTTSSSTTSATTDTSSSTTSATTSAPTSPAGTFGDCRYPRYDWVHSRAHAAQWLAVSELRICTLSYHDIVFATAQTTALPPNMERLSAAVAVVTLNGAMYGLTQAQISEQFSAFEQALGIVTHSINCATDSDYAELSFTLERFSNNTAACVGQTSGGGSHVGGDATVHKQMTSKEQGFLAWAIVMTVVAGVLCLLLVFGAFWAYSDYRRHAMMRGGGGGFMPGQQGPFGF